MSDSSHYHQGKDARRRGLPREIPDNRLTPKSRGEWYAGWDYQNEHMRPPPTEEQRAVHHAWTEALIDRLKSM